MSDTQRLRELAEAATPGPWVALLVGDPDKVAARTVDARYIVAADPRTVLALLEALAAREREVTALREALIEAQKGLGSVLWLANNVANATAQPIRFREFFDSMTEDVRRGYDAALAATATSEEAS